jgi:hypothetical protein
MAYEAFAVVTNEAKQRTGEMWAYGTSFIVNSFAISNGGCDPLDPTTAIAVDPSAVVMPGAPALFTDAITSVTWYNDLCPTFVCTLHKGDLVGPLSCVALYAQIVYLGVARPAGAPPAPLMGYQFLFAVYNRPQVILTATDGPTAFELTPFL